MNILFIGDIFASTGRSLVARYLQEIISTEKISLAIANAENSAGGFGITPLIAEELFSIGLDVLTSGNHIWDKKEIFDYLPRQPRLLRPANYPQGTAGAGPAGHQGEERRGSRGYRFAGPGAHAGDGLPVSRGRPASGVAGSIRESPDRRFSRRVDQRENGDGLVPERARVGDAGHAHARSDRGRTHSRGRHGLSERCRE